MMPACWTGIYCLLTLVHACSGMMKLALLITHGKFAYRSFIQRCDGDSESERQRRRGKGSSSFDLPGVCHLFLQSAVSACGPLTLAPSRTLNSDCMPCTASGAKMTLFHRRWRTGFKPCALPLRDTFGDAAGQQGSFRAAGRKENGAGCVGAETPMAPPEGQASHWEN